VQSYKLKGSSFWSLKIIAECGENWRNEEVLLGV